MSKLAKALTAAAGNAGGESLYVEDVFSTYLYAGSGTTQTITNGIDLDGEGGLVWWKPRGEAGNHGLIDTARGATKYLRSNLTSAESTLSGTLDSFNSNGFTVGQYWSENTKTFASWTFRKAEKFFDVVTWTGDGNAATQISHSLNSTPGAIIVKKTSATGNWSVYHSYLGTGKYLRLEQYFGDTTDVDYFPEVTDSYFRPGSDNHVNESGQSFVAYLFASDAGGFGDDGDENIIKCGSYTGTGGYVNVNVGFEPQFVIVKSADFGNSDTDWFIIDTMRGFTFNPSTNYEFQALRANESSAEAAQGRCGLTSTGFVAGVGDATGTSGRNYIYIAIRRPMKTPESGTEVFGAVSRSGTLTNTTVSSSFPVDLAIISGRTGPYVTYDGFNWGDRLRGGNRNLYSSNTSAENTSTDRIQSFAYQNAVGIGSNNAVNDNTATYINYFLKRATGFFDVVAYTGDGTSNRSINHNLGVTPGLIIGKIRSGQTDYWGVWQASLGNQGMYLSATNSAGTTLVAEGHTSSIFKVSNGYGINNVSTLPHIAYLFGSVAGVSKVGSYTGTGSNVDVDCGFSAGARFILIKRTDSTGDWYVWDSVRGIVAGNDPYLLLNSTAAEVTSTDYIDPLASGFTVTSSAPAALNASGGTYIFLAIA